jgi:UDP-3-O-[3-hydroxymyristoyl] glucosamine N-acyltransferase
MRRVLKVQELAALVGGTAPDAPGLEVTGAASLELATPSEVSFLENAAYLEQARKSRAGLILTREAFTPSSAVLVLVPAPRSAFARCLEFFHPKVKARGQVHESAVIDPRARLDEDVEVGPQAVVGAGSRVGARTFVGAGVIIGEGVEVGQDCRLHPGCVLLEGVRLGRRVVIQSRTVIGSDGFGYVQDGEAHRAIPHRGIVVLADDVEVGAGCCIDRAVVGETFVGVGTKIDNLVHIGHNVKIGANCLIVAQVGISGSVVVGEGCTLAGKVGVAGHLEIGAGAVVAAASRVVRSVPSGATVAGWPAMEVGLWRRSVALIRRLPRMWERLQALERVVRAEAMHGEHERGEDPPHGGG